MSVINFSVPTDLQIAGNLTVNSLNGLLKGTAGLVSAATAGVDYVIPTALTSTGVQLAATAAATYATIINLASTGQQAWTAANNNGINLSGNLTQTGQALMGFVLGGDTNLSGSLVSMSGQLVTQIQNAAGVLSLNGATGLLTLTSAPANANYVKVTTSGNIIMVSGNTTPLLSGITLPGNGFISGNNGSLYLGASGGVNEFFGQGTGGIYTLSVNGSTQTAEFQNNGGNAQFRVGDSVDGQFFSGQGQFHARRESANATIRIVTVGSINQSYLALDRSRGTFALPTAILSGDILGSVVGVGNYGDASVMAHGPMQEFATSENWSASGRGGIINFYTVPNTTTSQGLMMRVAGQSVHVGNTVPQYTPGTFNVFASNDVNLRVRSNNGICVEGLTNAGSLTTLHLDGSTVSINGLLGGGTTFGGTVNAGGLLTLTVTGDYTASTAASVAQLLASSGWLSNASTSNIVYTTGTQTITGLKTFGSGLFFGNIGAGSNPLLNGGAIYRLTVKGGNDNSIAVDNDGSQFTSVNLYNNATVKASYFWDQTNTTFNMVSLPSTAALVFVTQASQERMRILGGGNVGIGTAVPQEKLHVSGGNLRIDGSGQFAGNVTIANGLAFGTTGDYITRSGAASVAQLVAISGVAGNQYQNPYYSISKVTGVFSFLPGQYRYLWSGNGDNNTGILPSPSTNSGVQFSLKTIAVNPSSTTLTISGQNLDYNLGGITNNKFQFSAGTDSLTSAAPFNRGQMNLYSDGIAWLFV